MISWILDDAIGNPERESLREITLRVLALSFAAIHTTTSAAMFSLYILAANPQMANPLREELMNVTREYGWTKEAMDKCTLLDGFLKETQRISVGFGNSAYLASAIEFEMI
jgi:cytochrome P450